MENLANDTILEVAKYLSPKALTAFRLTNKRFYIFVPLERLWMKKMNWTYISQNKVLSIEFIKKHADKLDWEWLPYRQTLSDEIIIAYSDKIDWKYIWSEQVFSEEMIEIFTDRANWMLISQYQRLSESFIEKYCDCVDWRSIFEYQDISDTFKYKWKCMPISHRWFYSPISTKSNLNYCNKRLLK